MDHSSPYPPQPQLQQGHEYLQQPQAQPYSTNTANKMDYSSPYPPQPQAQAQPYSTNSENQVDYSSAYLPQPQLGYEHLQQPQQAQEQVFQHQDSLDSTQPQTYDPSHYPYPYPYDQQQQQYPYYPLTHQPISDPPPPRHLVMIAPKPHRGGRSGRPSRGRGRGRQIPSSSASLPRQPQAQAQAQAQVQAQPQRYHCEVCMVGCNSGEILEMHNKGKKHKKKLQELERASRKLETDESEKNAEGDGDAGAEPKGEEDGKKRKSVAGERGGKSRRLEGEADALVCEVCDVKCHTVAVMEIHLKGKKHRSKVGKLGPQIGTSEDPQIALTRLLRTYAASNARLDTAQIKCLVDLCNIVINSIAAASAPVESVEQVSDQSHEDKTQ